MACNSLSITASSLPKYDSLKEYHSLTRASLAKNICEKSRKMERSYSDHHLCYSVNRIRIKAFAPHPKLKASRSFEIFKIQLPNSIIPNSLRSLLFESEMGKNVSVIEHEGDTGDADTNEDTKDNDEDGIFEEGEEEMEKRANWIERLLEIRTHWRVKRKNESLDDEGVSNQVCSEDGHESGCEVEYDNDEEDEMETSVDRESFSKLLDQVSWSNAKTFARLAFLCKMAYAIPEIKANDFKKSYGLDFVTSSLEIKAEETTLKENFDENPRRTPLSSTSPDEGSNDKNVLGPNKKILNQNTAYEIAASAASYFHSCTKGLLSLQPGTKENDQNNDSYNDTVNIEVEEKCLSPRVYSSGVAVHMATSTMTVVVAAGETEKQKTAKDLQSLHSSPCEWFICDDLSTYTRCFIIQGSDSLASWQANLFFEPTKFEGTEVFVHRGIYEAAKGIYEQFMPLITEHLSKYGERAKLQFTGHSLGGSLALLVNLLLLTRKVANRSALRPVTTFGSPFVFCGGHRVMDELGISEDCVQCVMMHRDIVPRAFACNYPNHVVQILKRLSGSFQNHPCLNKKKLLYSPMGKIFILQPDQKSSPPHPFLPPGTALYAMRNTETTRHHFMKNALGAFLNTPHPLETLSDPTAYTSGGTIRRDHDSSNYLKAVNAVIRQERIKVMAKKATTKRKVTWPLLMTQSPHVWGHDMDLDGARLVNKEAMTSV